MRTLSCLVVTIAVSACGGLLDTPPSGDHDAASETGPAVTSIDASSKCRAAVPVFSPLGGDYAAAQNVSITTSTSNATIYYTLDGNTPNAASAKYSVPIAVAKTMTLRAIAMAEGCDASEVNSATYAIKCQCTQAATPTITPPGGTFTSTQTVTLATPETGGAIFYTTNGSLPTKATGTPYTAPLLVDTNTTIIAVTTANNKLDSSPTTAQFKIKTGE